MMLISIIGQLSPDQAKLLADEISQKDFKWWFAAILVILLSSGMMVMKQLIESAKEAHKYKDDMTQQYLQFMQSSHNESTTTQKQLLTAMTALTESIHELKISISNEHH